MEACDRGGREGFCAKSGVISFVSGQSGQQCCCDLTLPDCALPLMEGGAFEHESPDRLNIRDGLILFDQRVEGTP